VAEKETSGWSKFGWILVQGVVVTVGFGMVALLTSRWVENQLVPPDCTDQKSLTKVEPTDAQASSVLGNEIVSIEGEPTEFSYTADMAVDGDTGTAWAEGADGQGVGESITFKFPDTQNIVLLCVVNGYALKPDLYNRNSRIRQLQITGGDDRTQVVTLADAGSQERVAVFQPAYPDVGGTDELTLEILSTYAGTGHNRFGDTLLSEIEFWAE